MPVEAPRRETVQQLSPYVEAFERMPHDETRRAAFERFLALGFPTSRDEEWRFTNLAALARMNFAPAEARDPALAERIVATLPRSRNIVLLNGRHTASHEIPKVQAGKHFENLENAFLSLNTALYADRTVVHVVGIQLEPIHIIHISLPGARPAMTHPRTLLVFDPNAQGTVVETFVGENVYFNNAVTQIVAGERAVVEHIKIQRESPDSFHISNLLIEQACGSVVTSRSFAFGASLARTEIQAVLSEGSECILNGLYIVNGEQHVDTRTVIDHAKPHAESHELYKGILDGQSSAVFNGKIIVRKDAQKTDAKQTNKNLVLSEDATINTKPQLEIFADDVKCTHGATVGQLDADSMFYLRSRGIGAEAARAMLIQAFAREVVDGIKSEKFREYVGKFV